MAVKRTMYQHKVDVDMLNAVKSVLADVSSVSPSSELRQPTHSLRRSAYPHQLYVDTLIALITLPASCQPHLIPRTTRKVTRQQPENQSVYLSRISGLCLNGLCLL